MRYTSSWLFGLWQIEWDRDRKDWLRMVYAEVICVMLACVLFILFRTRLDAFMSYTLNLPEAVYAFWGIGPDVVTDRAAFYVQWFLMPMHVCIVWSGCERMIRSFWAEEERGSIYYLCNQWYSRQQIAIAKYLWNVVKFIVNYIILFLACAVLAGRGWGIGHLLGLFLKGMFVIVMFLTLSGCYAVMSIRRERLFWTDGLVVGTLVVGNLYKFRDLMILLLQRADRDYVGFYRLTRWLDGLKWLSPLSWLNPFTEYGVGETVVQIVICVLIVICAAALGLLCYRVRMFK